VACGPPAAACEGQASDPPGRLANRGGQHRRDFMYLSLRENLLA
jgi:hypothetical protein